MGTDMVGVNVVNEYLKVSEDDVAFVPAARDAVVLVVGSARHVVVFEVEFWRGKRVRGHGGKRQS